MSYVTQGIDASATTYKTGVGLRSLVRRVDCVRDYYDPRNMVDAMNSNDKPLENTDHMLGYLVAKADSTQRGIDLIREEAKAFREETIADNRIRDQRIGALEATVNSTSGVQAAIKYGATALAGVIAAVLAYFGKQQAS